MADPVLNCFQLPCPLCSSLAEDAKLALPAADGTVCPEDRGGRSVTITAQQAVDLITSSVPSFKTNTSAQLKAERQKSPGRRESTIGVTALCKRVNMHLLHLKLP